LAVAIIGGYTEIVTMLLEAGANVNATSHSRQTALTQSAYWGHLEVVKLLIAAGADLNARDREDDWTPLMKACLVFGSTEVVRVLLEAGADPNFRNDEGKTALAIALKEKRDTIAQILREFGAIE
jgi:uncharacterized protein